MNAIGIDIGASQHAVALFREGEHARRRVQRISATRAGFADLATLTRETGAVSRIVMEASGHYWMPLASDLGRRGLPVALVPPISAKYFAKRTRQRAKSDPADARTLAAMASVDRPEVRDPLGWRGAARGRALCDVARRGAGPHLQSDRPPHRPRLPRAQAGLGRPHLHERPGRAAPRRHGRLPESASRRSPGRTREEGSGPSGGPGRNDCTNSPRTRSRCAELEGQLGFEMRLLIEQYDGLERQIALAEARVAGMLDSQLARRLETIGGCGPAVAATLIAEIGDIFRFSNFDKLVSFIGVHAAERSSGEKGKDPETSWRMAKTENKYVRTALYRMAVTGLQHNPVLRAHYERKRAQGKSKMNALGHCMKKALALVWGVWRSEKDFDPSLHGA